MRCKVGDLCLIVRAPAWPELLGRTCTVVGPALTKLDDWSIDVPSYPATGALVKTWGSMDAFLRPLRDNDGEDETLALAGRPELTALYYIEEMERDQ